ncbi:MAG: threonine/serine dehydratase [Anaerolineae bacterium]
MIKPSFRDILTAQRNLGDLIRRTPLEYSPLLSRKTGCQLYLKLENWQKTGSFKVRGATNKVASLSEVERAKGLVTASSGNHGLGVFYAARAFGGLKATVFVPTNAPRSKVERLQTFEGQLFLEGKDYDEADLMAQEFARKQGAAYIHACWDPVGIAGQGTVGLEIMSDLPKVEALLVPVGGGGLISGVAIAAKTINPQVRVIGVQSEASPSGFLSLKDGHAYERYEAAPTIADGLAGGFGKLPLELIKGRVEEIVLVTEEEIRAAVLALLESDQLVVEGSGAVGVAALLFEKVDLRGKKVVAILSGGNIDADLLFQIMRERYA